MTNSDLALRTQLVELLDGHQAHIELLSTLRKISVGNLSKKPDGAPSTLWELFEHMRIAQSDILHFCQNPSHISPEWPEGYWPNNPPPTSHIKWEESIAAFRRDLDTVKALVLNPEINLHEALPHGNGQTMFREVLLVADHNAYHLGQLVLTLKMIGSW